MWEKCAINSSIIETGVLLKNDAFVPLAGSVRRRRSRRHDFQHGRGGQAGSACAARLQSHLVGHHPDQMEPAAPRAYAQRLQDVAAVADQFKPSPLVGVFEGGYEEYRRQIAVTGALRNPLSIQRGMQIGASEGITRLERNLPWLAITAAVTPFVGLFGTVWGIIDAFHGLGTAGAATLRAVAPGISEALITTAAGLAAAIPAVIAYNLIGASIREFAARSDDFALEVLNAVEHSSAQAPVEVRR